MTSHNDQHDLPKFSEDDLIAAHNAEARCGACGDSAGDEPIVYVLTFCGNHGRQIEKHGLSVSIGPPKFTAADSEFFSSN